MLKEIPRDTVFTIRLIEPLKAGFCKYYNKFMHNIDIPCNSCMIFALYIAKETSKQRFFYYI